MDRRSALKLVFTLASLTAPAATRAQSGDRLSRVGWLSPTTPVPRPRLRERLTELGWVEGRNLVFIARAAEGERSRLPALAVDLVAANVDVIVAVAPAAIRAARQATSRIPIVMAWWGGPDLVEAGIVQSLARPGGNITGVHMLLPALEAKRLDLLLRAVPKARKIAVLVHEASRFSEQLPPVREVARSAGIELLVFDTEEGGRGYEGAFEAMRRSGAEALLVMSSPDFGRDRKLIAEMALRSRMPAIQADEVDEALMTYGVVLDELDRRAANYIDRILRGANPAELPVEQPTRFKLVLNLKTARSLGITIPYSLVLQADQTIQ
jgi:putative ABC transport system substrate-binding protein